METTLTHAVSRLERAMSNLPPDLDALQVSALVKTLSSTIADCEKAGAFADADESTDDRSRELYEKGLAYSAELAARFQRRHGHPPPLDRVVIAAQLRSTRSL